MTVVRATRDVVAMWMRVVVMMDAGGGEMVEMR
jgi:hypothetical protein